MNNRKGPMHGSIEQAKDFKKTLKKLLSYLKDYKVGIFFVIIFAIFSTLFNIIGPKILGNMTTEIFSGLIRKIMNVGGIDFIKIGQICFTLIILYLSSLFFSFIQGIIMSGVSNKVSYRLRKEMSEKINRLPMKYFDQKTHGEILSRVTNDIDTLSQSLNQCITQIISSIATIVGVLIMMISINIPMTVVSVS